MNRQKIKRILKKNVYWKVQQNSELHLWEFKSFIRWLFSGPLSSLRPVILLCPPPPVLICLRTLLWVLMHPSAKMDLEVKASGRSKTHYGLALSRVLTHKKPFCVCVVSPLLQKSGGRDPWILYSYRLLPPLCPCHDYHLKVFTRDKHWLFTQLLLPFQRANRRLIVNTWTKVHLSLLSEMLTQL